jgi:sugar lactone lactonase YvrE
MASFAARMFRYARLWRFLPGRSVSIAILGLVFSASLQAAQPSAHLSVSQRMLPLPGFDQTFPFDEEPYGVAVDQSGNLYVTDEEMGTVTEVQQSGDSYFAITLLQGLTSPVGIAVDAQENLYITENGGANNVIKETASVLPYETTYTQSVIPVSGLGQPSGIAVDATGSLYITDLSNNRIVKETPSGNSYTQSTIPSSALSMPYGVAVDISGDVFIADFGHNRVLQETPGGGSYTESVVSANTGNSPLGVAVDGSGTVYVLNFVDQETSSVLKETPGQGGYVQSAIPVSPTLDFYSIAADGSGSLYLAAPGENHLAKIVAGAGDLGEVNVTETSLTLTLIFTFDQAGAIGKPSVLTEGVSGFDFSDAGTGSCGKQGTSFVYNVGDICTVDVLFAPAFPSGRYGAVELTDTSGQPIALGYVYGEGISQLVGFPPGVQTTLDSGLAHPMGVAVDNGGNIYIAESRTGKVYKESPGGATRTIVAQGLNTPTGVALDGAGNIYVAASGGVYKETPSAGGYLQSEIAVDLNDLAGIAVDGAANLYLISSSSGDVHKETLSAGGAYSETAIGSGIANPSGVAVDGDGDIFVADARQGTLYEETHGSGVGYAQSKIATGLNAPAGIAADGAGHLFVTVSGDSAVYEYALQIDGTWLKSFAFAVPSTPAGIGVDNQKNLYIAQNVGDGTLTKIDIADPPTLNFPNTRVGSTSPAQTVTVADVGNVTLGVDELKLGATPNPSTGYLVSSETTCPTTSSNLLFANTSCVYAIEFAPKQHASYAGGLVVTSDNLNVIVVKQTVGLRGLGVTSDTTRTTMRISPDPVTMGLGVTMTVTVTDTTNAASVPTGGVSLTDTVGNTTTSLNGGIPVPLSGGQAVLTMVPNVAGTHTITAHYNGVSPGFAGSTFAAALTVQP